MCVVVRVTHQLAALRILIGRRFRCRNCILKRGSGIQIYSLFIQDSSFKLGRVVRSNPDFVPAGRGLTASPLLKRDLFLFVVTFFCFSSGGCMFTCSWARQRRIIHLLQNTTRTRKCSLKVLSRKLSLRLVI